MPHLVSRRLRPVLLCLLLALVLPAASPSAVAAAETCTDTPASGYIVRVCLVAPDGLVILGGQVDVVARVEIVSATVPAPSVNRVVFKYRDEYLLSDNDADPVTQDYRMTWRTTRMVDGTGSFEVKARLSDAVEASHFAPVTLANGVTTPPVNTRAFQVRQGTTPAPGARFRLAAVGDGSDGSLREEQVADQIASWSPNLLAYLGDAYERGSYYEYDNWYANPRGYGRFRDITNPTVGNHEYLVPGAAGYFDYWDNVPHYYSYDVAGWHVASIDTSEEFGQLTAGTPQYDWLAADLGANRSRCTIVYMHHPRYLTAPIGGRTGLTQVWSLLAARRVTLLVTGHAHRYERWTPLGATGSPDPRGVTQLVAGAGGHRIAPPEISDSRVATTVTEMGALRLDLGTDDAQFAYVTATGDVRDSGTIGCTSTGDTLPPTTPSGLLVSPTSATTARVSWSPSTDQYSAVAGYTVRRNGVVVATVDPGTTTYADTGLVSGETYTWTVDAFDTSANYSPQSSPAATTMPAPVIQTVSSRKLLAALPVRKESDRGYLRAKFRTWVDADGDRCNTRGEVLLAEATKPPTLLPVCKFAGGRWYSRYDGVSTTDRTRLGVEHLVPLREVWQSGGRRWTALTRQRFANDLGYRPTLNMATNRMLDARGPAEPQDWLPPRASTRCVYLAQWVAVKWRWRLGLDRPEKRFLAKRLSACGWLRVEQPVRAPVARW
ncbi:MAG: fibronectin type III domain-containing protein [Sporichthyaceae bacterium]|nr:fibronectin type III domain-containing protein [Sporichthyaceae bacterium]